MRAVNISVKDILDTLSRISSEFCDIEIDERTNTVYFFAILPPKQIEDKKEEKKEEKRNDKSPPQDLENFI